MESSPITVERPSSWMVGSYNAMRIAIASSWPAERRTSHDISSHIQSVLHFPLDVVAGLTWVTVQPEQLPLLNGSLSSYSRRTRHA